MRPVAKHRVRLTLLIVPLLVTALTPVSALAKTPTLTLTGVFSTSRLSDAQQIAIEKFIRANPGSAKLMCTGYFPPQKAGISNSNSRKVAASVCDFAGQINRQLTLVAQGKSQIKKSASSQVVLTLTADDSIGSGYLDCDSPLVDTKMASISQKNVMTVLCAEDRQKTSVALPANLAQSKPELCEIRDISKERTEFDTLMVGFPRHTNNIKSVGRPKISVVPVDWSDLPGSGKPSALYAQEIQKYRDYYQMVSYGKLNLDIQFNDRWFRLPGSMADYKVTQDDYRAPYSERTKSQKMRLFQNGVSAADSAVDFTSTEMVIFLLPPGQQAIDVTLQAFKNGDLPKDATTSEGPVSNFMAAGNELPIRMFWSYWAHEFGHAIMLPDWYVTSANFGNYDSIQIPVGPFSGYDLMSTNGGPSMSVSMWSRWIMNWQEPGHIFCTDFTSFRSSSFKLDPIDNQTNLLKSVMIRVSETKAVIVESRRKTKYDEPTLRSRNGILVYTIDTKLGHGEGAKALVAPTGRGLYYPYKNGAGAPQLDAILYQGNRVDVEGLRITVNSLGKSDVVSIEKTSG